MEKKRPAPRYSPVLPVLALAVILAGLFAMSGVFTESQRQLLDGQDGQLTKTAQSVDNNILGHFVWYCSDLNTSRRGRASCGRRRTISPAAGRRSCSATCGKAPCPKPSWWS